LAILCQAKYAVYISSTHNKTFCLLIDVIRAISVALNVIVKKKYRLSSIFYRVNSVHFELSFEMNKKEIDAINALRHVLTKNLDTKSVISFLYSGNHLTRTHYYTLNAILNPDQRCLELLDTIQCTDCPFSEFLNALTDAKQNNLRTQLEKLIANNSAVFSGAIETTTTRNLRICTCFSFFNNFRRMEIHSKLTKVKFFPLCKAF
jgi:hypothetical protein